MMKLKQILKPFQREMSIANAFLALSLLVTTALIIFFAVGSTITFHFIVETIFKERIQTTQNLFTQGLSQDLITGSNHEAYRKCKAFFTEADVVAISVLTINGNEICALNKTAEQTLNLQSQVYFDEGRANVAGTVKVSYSLDKLSKAYWSIVSAVFALLFGLFFIQVILLKKISKTVTQPIKSLSDRLKSGHLEDFVELQNKSYIIELNVLNEGLRELSRNSLELQKSKILRAEGEAAIQIAKQVSHDIRSPLSALTLLMGSLQTLPEDKRILVRNAVNRINDIANTLLSKSKNSATSTDKDGVSEFSQTQITLLTPLIDNIVSEKRIQFREKQGIEIESDINQGYGIFASINANELKRTISNLVNNAVEAFANETGKITVALRNYGEQVAIIIQDNGKGIPEHILNKLGKMGVSHGKEGTQSGSGLGVYHAKKTVEDSGGKFQIQSREGAGTSITMTFNKAKAPKWFVEKLVLAPNMEIASLDDDISIHQIWKGRFESLKVFDSRIQHLTFTSGVEFKDWIKKLQNTKDEHVLMSGRLYLVDYELLNQNATGLDIIEELGIGPNTILVSSRYEEEKIRDRCDRLGIRLIPKAMAGFVPIEVEKEKLLYDGILIDDDNIPQMTWSFAAKEQKKRFIGFSSPDDFFKQSPDFDKASPLFVDSNLGNGIKGEDVAKRAFDLGFVNVNLATGYDPCEFQPMPWIKRIVGKDPFPPLS